MLRRVTIVFEETGEEGGSGFNAYLAGDKDRIPFVPVDELSPAEYWGGATFSLCIQAMREAGVIQAVVPTNEESKGMH